MKSLKSILDKKNIRKAAALDDKTVFFIFKKISSEYFGILGSGKVTPDYFAKGILFIKADSPAWGNELWMNKKAIIDRMNDEIGEKTVRDIKLK